MRRVLASIVVLLALTVGAEAEAQPWQRRGSEPSIALSPAEVPPAEQADMRALIGSQIEAMRRHDAQAAFALATPELQLQYGSARHFLDQIARHYAPLPDKVAGYAFLDVVQFRGYPTYRVILRDTKGRSTLAYYLIRRLSDGTLRIAGCVFARPGTAAVEGPAHAGAKRLGLVIAGDAPPP